MDYDYALNNDSPLKATEFFNPSTLKNNHFLHAWRVFSTSPFENGVVYSQDAGAVSSVTVSPATASVVKGQAPLQMSATVVTTGFVNKAVLWSVDSTSKTAGVKIDEITGVVTIPADATLSASDTITVTATSVYDSTVTGTATLTVLA